MPVGHYRASRLPFVAGVQVMCMDTGNQIEAHTEDLTLFGCFVETTTPFGSGTRVALPISHNGQVVIAQGNIAHSEEASGMGIRFTSMEQSSASILDAWIAELRE